MIFKNIIKKKYSLVSQKGALEYTISKAIETDSFNMLSNSQDIKSINQEMKELQKANGVGEKSRKYYHYLISPSEKNVEPKKLLELSKEFLERELPNCQASLSVHNDNGINHCHLIINATTLDVKQLQVNNKKYDTMRVVVQEELAKKYNLEQTLRQTNQKGHNYIKKQKVVYDSIDKAMDSRNKPSEKNIIVNAVSEILKNQESKNLEQFEKTLKNYNIELQTYKTKNGEIKLSYKTENLKSGISQDKLGEIFSLEYLNQYFENLNKEKEIEKKKTDGLIEKYSNQYKEQEKNKIEDKISLSKNIIKEIKREQMKQLQLDQSKGYTM